MKKPEPFEMFLEELCNSIDKEKDISWDDDCDVAIHVLNFLKSKKRNWIDVGLIGFSLIDSAFIHCKNALCNDISNINAIKLGEVASLFREQSNGLSKKFKDIMLLATAYNKSPIDNINCNMERSDMISYNLKRRFYILARYDFKCVYCGRCPPEVRLELEHVLPISKGGNNSEDNLVPACWECNSGKRAEIIEEIKNKRFDKAGL